MHTINAGPRFSGVYQVVAKKPDGNRDLKKEEQIFEALKACDGDVFDKVAENLHKEERNRHASGEGGTGTHYDPTRSFLFTKLANVITILTGGDAQALAILHPQIKAYPKKSWFLPLEQMNVGRILGRIKSDAEDDQNPENSTVLQFFSDAKINTETLPQLDYNGFESANKLKDERLGHEEEHRTLARRFSEHSGSNTPIVPPRRSYSGTSVAPRSPQEQQPDSLSASVHRSYSASLVRHARRPAGWDSPQ